MHPLFVYEQRVFLFLNVYVQRKAARDLCHSLRKGIRTRPKLSLLHLKSAQTNLQHGAEEREFYQRPTFKNGDRLLQAVIMISILNRREW